MWQEMRKHEKKLRGMIVDYKRRSERRKEYYERIKRDPAEFLQIWGRPAKIHLDPAIATAAESTLTPWRDDETTLIDRFDVRSHLDIIDEYALKHQQNQQDSEFISEAESNEERLCHYERYRVLIHNESTGVREEQCLRDIEFDEKFGALRDDHHPASREAKKKKSTTKKAEIGFVYDDAPMPTSSRKTNTAAEESDDEDDDDDDLDIEIDVTQLTSENKASLNKVATHYGMAFGDFARMLILDREEMQTIRDNKLEREQDLPVKGRRARRERRLAKERRIKERDYCPPNYLSREIPKLPALKAKSKSRSPSPVDTTPVKEKIEFITAFGDDDASKIDAKRKRPFEKSLLDECRDAKKKAEPTVIPIRTRRLVTPPRLPPASTPSIVPFRSVQRNSQVLLSTLQKLKEDSSPERRVISDDDKPAIQIVRSEKKADSNHNNDDEEDDEDDDLQQYLKRKEARQHNQHSVSTPSSNKDKHDSQESTSKSSSAKTPQEKLKRRMQSLLKKQFQKDKDQQRERQEREEREREARESELRQSSTKLRHHHSRHHSSSRSRTRSRSRSPIPRRPRPRSSSSSSSSSSTSSHHSSTNRNKRRSSPVKARSPTPEFLRQRFRRDRRRQSSSSSSSSSSDRSSSKRKRTDHK